MIAGNCGNDGISDLRVAAITPDRDNGGICDKYEISRS